MASEAGQDMVIIRGRVEPNRSPGGSGTWRHLMGRGRWRLEYLVRDDTGQLIEQGDFRADASGCFVLGVDAPAPATVEIRVKEQPGAGEDACRVRILSANDVVNLPRKLYPCNGHRGPHASDSRIA